MPVAGTGLTSHSWHRDDAQHDESWRYYVGSIAVPLRWFDRSSAPIVSRYPLIYSGNGVEVPVEVEEWVRFLGNESAEVSEVDKPGADPLAEAVQEDPEEGRQERVKPPSERLAPVPEHAAALAKVSRLEVELERYRAHAERTSRLFDSVTRYADWVRESARRDSELALRKARIRVEKLNWTTSELERTESELARKQDELARLQALTDETRARLSAFLTAGLEALNSKREDEADEASPARGNLEDTLQERLMSASPPTPTPVPEVENPQR